MAISNEKLEEVQSDIVGTCKSLTQIIEEHGLDIEENDLQDRLLDGAVGAELCVACNWWHEVSELEYSEELNGGLCGQCLADEGLDKE